MSDQRIRTPRLFRNVSAEASNPDSSGGTYGAIRRTAQPPRQRDQGPPCESQSVGLTTESPYDHAASDRSRAELTHALERVADAIEKLTSQRGEICSEMQTVAAEIGVTVAEWVLHREIANGRHAVEKIVEGIVAECAGQSPLAIHLHPDDVAQIETEGLPYDVRADASISRGDCRAELGDFWVAFQWRDRLHELKTKIMDEIQDARS